MAIDIVFDGPSGPEGPRFIEIEQDGRGIKYGEWLQRDDGYWVIRVPDLTALKAAGESDGA